MGMRSRSKGKRGEMEAAAEISRLFHVAARRGRQYQGGDDSPDVVTGIPGIHFEVKRVESLRLYPAVEQAAAEAGGGLPVVLHRPNGKPWVAIVRLEDLPQVAVQLYLAMVSEGATADDH